MQQALRDVAAWAERDVVPPRSTRYEVADSQIQVPGNAAVRRGIQPTVDVSANGDRRVDIAAGETVRFWASVRVPPHAGDVVATEWDFTGTGDFAGSPLRRPRPMLVVRASFTYDEPGTYYPALRVTAQRDGDPVTPFARVQSLGRVRVVVH